MNSLFVAEKEFSKDGYFSQDQSRIQKHDSSVFSNIYDQIPERKDDLNDPFDRIKNDYDEEDVILINDKSNDENKSDDKFDSDLTRENMEVRRDEKKKEDSHDVIKSDDDDKNDTIFDSDFESDLIRESKENNEKKNKDFNDAIIKSYGIDTEDNLENLMHISQSNNRDKILDNRDEILDNLDDDNIDDQSDDVDARSLSQKNQGKT